MVSIITNGEGWHNYHHVFPWDYKAAELGLYRYNLSTALIDLFALMGLAYDLKTVPEKIVLQRVKRTGDGSYNNNKKQKLENVIDLDTNENSLEAIINGRAGDENRSHSWGWDDTDTSQEDKQVTVIFYEKSA
jgi:stearoyl-CoA desaturase (delta-9 desaturase)